MKVSISDMDRFREKHARALPAASTTLRMSGDPWRDDDFLLTHLHVA